MKLSAFLLFVACLQASAGGYGQRITLAEQNASLETIFRKIEQQTNYLFWYKLEALQSAQKVDINVKNASLDEVLKACFQDQQFTYRVAGNTVTVKRRERLPLYLSSALPQPLPDIQGRIVDESGQGVPGATVFVKDANKAVVTDENGNFLLKGVDKKAVLVVRSLGFQQQEIPVAGKTRIDVKLIAIDAGLNEIVVVGYGTVKKKDLTGAVASIDNTKYENLPNTNITQALRGTVPGVSISRGGNAGSGQGISIRGQTSITGNTTALVVVDGIIYNGQLGNLNPNDIASIDVLKDASSAAIFGARAANGVVLITTKKGTSDKPVIQFNSYAGTQSFLPHASLETPQQYVRKVMNYQKTLAFRGVSPAPDESDPGRYLNADEQENFEKGITTDPLKKISQAAPIQNYSLSISAKTDKTNYFISGAYTDQQGKVKGDRFKRASIRVNLESNVTSWLKFGTTSAFSFVDVSNAPADITAAIGLSPYGKWYLDDAQTVLNPFPMTDGLISNPLLPTLNKVTKQRKELFGIFYGEVSIPFIQGLSYRFTYSNNILYAKEYEFVPSFNAGGLNRVARASNAITESQDMYLENLVKYNRTFAKDHNVDVTLLYNYNFAKDEKLTAGANTFPSEVLTFYGLSLGENQTTAASYSDYHAIAMMGRLNYKFRDRYLLTLTGRRDGASIFSRNHKFAFFPSMALGWVMSDEHFLKNNRIVDFLKLRLSYGANGNLPKDRYQSLDKITTGNNYLLGGLPAYGIAKTVMGNPDLKWESTYAINIGADFELFKSRISGSVNYYNADTRDLILSRTIPSLNGFSSILSNLGAVNNKGFELSLNTLNVKRKSFEWSTGFNFTLNRNKIVHLYGKKDEKGKELDDIANGWFIGKSLGAHYNYEREGIWQTGDDIPTGFRAGDIKLKDQNGDGMITPASDRVILGYDRPDYTFGFNTTLRYRNFSLYTQLSGSIGGLRNTPQLLDPSEIFIYRIRGMNIDWWTPEDPSNKYPSMDYQNSYGISWLQHTTYVRIQDISLSYELPQQMLERWKIKRLQVYVSAKDPFLFTKWVGWDPETTDSQFRTQYPTLRSVIAGINLSL